MQNIFKIFYNFTIFSLPKTLLLLQNICQCWCLVHGLPMTESSEISSSVSHWSGPVCQVWTLPWLPWLYLDLSFMRHHPPHTPGMLTDRMSHMFVMYRKFSERDINLIGTLFSDLELLSLFRIGHYTCKCPSLNGSSCCPTLKV